MSRRVLVTRPEPGATRTARRLADVGLAPLILPLSETLALPIDFQRLPERIAAVALTSASAVEHAPRELAGRFADLPCFAVGRSTAEAASQAGFRNVAIGPGDAERLAAAIIEAGLTGPVLYLCGRLRRPAFETALAKAGILVFPVETYDTRRIAYPREQVDRVLGGLPVDLVLLYSTEAAKAFRTLAARPFVADLIGDAVIVCLSGRVAEALEALSPAKIIVAAEPNEDALLSSLRNST